MARWFEPTSRAYIGFMSEKTTFTASPMTDLDGTLKTNYYLTDRTKQYLAIADAITVKNAASAVDPTTYTLQRLGAVVRMNAALTGTPTVTMDGSFVPLYPIRGGKSFGNTGQRAEIDLTGGDNTDMVGAPGRPKRGGSFTFMPGDTIVNAAAKTVTLKTMIEAAAKASSECVFVFQNDIRNALIPRDVMYGFIGNTDVQRNLNSAIDMPITFYQAPTSDGTSSFEYIDYVA